MNETTGQPPKSPKRPFRRRRTVTRGSGRKNSDKSSTNGLSVSKTTGREGRRNEVITTVRNALIALDRKRKVDWTRESEEIAAAQVKLEDAMISFIDGEACREEVKVAYQAWANLLIIEGDK